MNKNQIRICENEDCQVEYTLTPNKPGKINVCSRCGREQELKEQESGMRPTIKVPVRTKIVLN